MILNKFRMIKLETYHYFVIKINVNGNEVEKYTRMIFNSLF